MYEMLLVVFLVSEGCFAGVLGSTSLLIRTSSIGEVLGVCGVGTFLLLCCSEKNSKLRCCSDLKSCGQRCAVMVHYYCHVAVKKISNCGVAVRNF